MKKLLLITCLLLLSFTSNAQEESYIKLQRSLRAFSTNNYITVFRNTDYNFSATSLSGYLQSEMRLASKDFKYGNTVISETFIPKASKNSEFLKVQYFVTNRTDIIGYVDADQISIINSVQITGTPKLVAQLFLNYWPEGISIKSDKTNNIATKELLSDYITMVLLPNNIAEIKIGKGNMEVNYEKTYGINLPKNQN